MKHIDTNTKQNLARDLVNKHVLVGLNQVMEVLMKARYDISSLSDWEDELDQLERGAVDWEECAQDDGWKEMDGGGYFKPSDHPQFYLSVNLVERGEIYVSVHALNAPSQGANGVCVWEFRGTDEEAETYDGSDTLDMTDPDELLAVLIEQGILPDDATLTDDEEGEFETSEAESWEELCRDEDLSGDDYTSEIYEYWAVDDYLSWQLKKRGEVVVELMGMMVWGRCTTGQAICIDGVIERIVEDSLEA